MLGKPLAWVSENLRRVLKPVIGFEFWSTLIFVVSFAPASGWLLNRLVAASGQYAVSDHDLVAFFLSLAGLLFLVLSIGFVLAFWFAEQVALLLLIVHARAGRSVSVGHVLWEHVRHLPALVRLGIYQGVALLVAFIPFGLGLGLTYWLLLTEWDLYYYLNVQPRSWWIALAVGGTLAAAYLLLAAWLSVRWLFSVPLLVFENAKPLEALKSSWRRTRRRFLELGLPLMVSWLVVLTASFVMTWLIRALSGRLLAVTGPSLGLLVPTVVGTLLLLALVDIVWFIIGKTVHVMLMAGFYLETCDVKPELREPDPAEARISPAGLRRLGWLAAGVVLLVGLATGVASLWNLDPQSHTVAITGHRGSKVRAPENTLSALRQAIDEGADYAEIDVQTTADGVVVLLHDADLRRVASVSKRLRDLSYGELKDIDVGSWFDPDFASERIPTLREAIEMARAGGLLLNIELKFTWPDPNLTRKVLQIVHDEDFASDCVLSSLNYPALAEVKQRAPELTTGFIVLQAVGRLDRMEADFLSINAARATTRLVRAIHGHGRQVHVWTVNDLNDALSMIERGVDNIITDHPRDVRLLMEAWNELSSKERVALMARSLIVGIEPPRSTEL